MSVPNFSFPCQPSVSTTPGTSSATARQSGAVNVETVDEFIKPKVKSDYESAPAFLEAARQFYASSPGPETSSGGHQLSDVTNSARPGGGRFSFDPSLSSGQPTPALTTRGSTSPEDSQATAVDTNRVSGQMVPTEDADPTPREEAVAGSSAVAIPSWDFSNADPRGVPQDSFPQNEAPVPDPSSDDRDTIAGAPLLESGSDTVDHSGERQEEMGQMHDDPARRSVRIQEPQHPRHDTPRKRDAAKARLGKWRNNVSERREKLKYKWRNLCALVHGPRSIWKRMEGNRLNP